MGAVTACDVQGVRSYAEDLLEGPMYLQLANRNAQLLSMQHGQISSRSRPTMICPL